MAISVSQRSPGARRAAALALAVGVVTGLAGASYALVVPRPASRVASAPAPMLTIRAQSSTQTATRGGAAVYDVLIGGYGRQVVRPGQHPKRQPLRVWLSAVKPLPRGVIASFAPPTTRSSASILTLRTKPSARTGRFRIRLRARGHLGAPGHRRMRHAWAIVTLVVVSSPRSAFPIAGPMTTQLVPGRVVPLDVRLTNLRANAMKITRLSVSLAGVRAPKADASHPCTVGDFAVVQSRGPTGCACRRSARAA